jgi:hypothetical protein
MSVKQNIKNSIDFRSSYLRSLLHPGTVMAWCYTYILLIVLLLENFTGSGGIEMVKYPLGLLDCLLFVLLSVSLSIIQSILAYILIGSWMYNYICNQCISPLMLWVRISIRAKCTTLCDKVCQWLATGRWFSPGPPISLTDKFEGSWYPILCYVVGFISMFLVLLFCTRKAHRSGEMRWWNTPLVC